MNNKMPNVTYGYHFIISEYVINFDNDLFNPFYMLIEITNLLHSIIILIILITN